MKQFNITKNDADQRLDKYLVKLMPALPLSLMHKYIRLKRVKVNGRRSEASYRLSVGDLVELYINDEHFERPDARNIWQSAPKALDIVFEDEHVLLCDKPAGLVVHEDESGGADTLINRIKRYLYDKGEWDAENERSFAPALCNRIDRNTGGIVLAAKNAEALRILNEKIRLREVEKRYLALVHGTPSRPQGILRGQLFRDRREKRVYVTEKRAPGTVTAELEYRVLKSGRGLSLLECRLLTGRTHQIRAQMAAAGHPLAGDTKYGTAARNRDLPFTHQALYSYKLCFDFRTPAGTLDYLGGRCFEVARVPFADYI